MKILNAVAAICVILYVADHFAREIYVGYKARMIEQQMRSEDLRKELKGMGILR
ncbi:hypothetical protein SAMN04244581_05102 [Paracoccus denitrificans]|jgi:hypothetical protein|nr:hypothetical protein [Paracoccus denitrificans]GEK71349.1 hypothetical protein PDE01_48690 [Paracoccus denitrificans]SDJ93577.1 hypothetical protein SAMN04244581_05102 [Paracoccus denitrificans]SFR22913.1 hypothetical protein SAMN04244569_05046 [Paracoccus denitrificans]